MLPREIFKIGLSKIQFPAFPGPELVWAGRLKYVKISSLKIYEIFDLPIIITVYSCAFLVDSKTNSTRKECTNLR